ncbi:serine-protein kinase ATM-like [Saccoglossus kowalevskii]|uniref:non-specific serine/threonine protein kinase n=1 Tax=Saccoglossus kowalevskii TaxID=10224 RepID=A0ABM0M526_SACKO|nr:PREDICTED: serine-protein kinase ATM-like [Saccoglossus kowalevskii]
MNELLTELISCCGSLNTDKATERKRQAENFKRILTQSKVIQCLDSNSDQNNRSGRLFTWDHVFKAVRNFIDKEIDVLRKAKGASATVIRRKQEISTLFKWTIRIANKRGERLKCNDIIVHIKTTMNDDFTCEAFGVDYSNVLLKDVLGSKKYWCDMSQKTWMGLLSMYCHTILEYAGGFNRDTLSQIIYVLICGATTQCNVQNRRLFDFFTEITKHFRNEKSSIVLVNIITAMNSFCQSVAINCRRLICKLGEDVLPTLLFLWSQRPSPDLKNFKPRINTSGEVHNRKWWSTTSTSSRETTLKENYVSLAADVCHQIFSEKTTEIEVTQMTFVNTQPGSRSKRRRLESGWEMIRDALTQQGHMTETIPWLQLLYALLSQHPTGLPSEEIQPFLITLHQLLTETKRNNTTGWLLDCLSALAYCQSNKIQTLFITESCHPLWMKVWSSTLRVASLHHAEKHGFHLLCVLIETQLVTADKEIWKLLAHGTCQPTQSAVQCLSILLKHCQIPENLEPNATIAMGIVTRNFPLRHILLNWILPNEENGDVSEKQHKTVDRPSVTVISEVLAILTQRCTSTISPWKPQLEHCQNKVLQATEDIYMKSSFDLIEGNQHGKESFQDNRRQNSTLNVVLKSLIRMLDATADRLLEITSTEVVHVENMVHHCAVITKVMSWLLGYQAITKDDLHHSKLFGQIKLLLKRILMSITKGRRDAETAQRGQSLLCSNVVRGLKEIYTWDAQDADDNMTDAVSWMACTCRNITPAGLVDFLLKIASCKGSNPQSGNRTSVFMTMAEDEVDGFMDVEFDTPGDTDNGFDDFGGMNGDKMELIGTTNNTAKQSILLTDILTEPQRLCLDCIRLLCTWCVSGATDENTVHGVDPVLVKEQLLDLLDEETFDVSKPFDLQMFFTIGDGFLAECPHVLDSHLEILLDALKRVASTHRKDQEICSAVLLLLARIIPCLNPCTVQVSDTMEDAREIALHLLSVFWKLQSDGQYSSSARLNLVRCMQAFIQIDPHGKWAVMKQKAREKGGGDRDMDVSLAEQFPDLLNDRCHGVRMQVAEAVTGLFVMNKPDIDGDALQPLCTDLQDMAFTKVLGCVQEAAVVPSCVSVEEQDDERSNRVASLLKTLSTIAYHSPVCEKRCVFALIQAVKENNIDIDLMLKVMKGISSNLKFPDVRSFLDSHLGYIISKWLEVGYDINDMPFRLFSCTTRKQFFKQHFKVMIPYIIMNNKIELVQTLGAELQTDWKQLLVECFPQIIVHIIPTFAHTREGEDFSNEQKKRKAHASQVLTTLQDILTQEVVEKLIQSHLDEIVVVLLMTLHEPHSLNSDIGQFVKDTDPQPNPPSFTSYTIKATLDYLTECHQVSGSSNKSLISLLSKTQDSIQKILLHLHTHMARAHHIHEKRRALLMYRLFVILLLTELHLGLGGTWAFVLQDIIYTLVHFMGDVTKSSDLILLCIDLLHTVCESATKCCYEEFGRHLHVIVTALIPHAEEDTDVGRQATSLLEYLIVENETKLSKAIEEIDPLPSSMPFVEARKIQNKVKYNGRSFNLLEEIHHFLRVGHTCKSSNRLEGLKYLRQHLADKKDDLAVLVSQCEENPSESTLLLLICDLIHLVQVGNYGHGCHGNQKAIQEEAGRCLGEIGAADLSTIALKYQDTNTSYSTAVKVYKGNSGKRRNSIIIHLLQEYLTDPSVDIVSASADCLKNIFSTPSGRVFYEDYKSRNIDSVLFYLHPFKPHKKSMFALPTISADMESFSAKIGDPLLWIPDHGSHDDWICNLATTLINDGGINDEFLRLLTPICKVKVSICERVLPFLVHEILLIGNETYKQVLSQQIQGFFSRHCGDLEDSSKATTPLLTQGESSCTGKITKQSVRTMLDVIHYLRLQNKPKFGRSKAPVTVWNNNFWLDIDYVLIAKAAQSCAAHFTCVLYSEIWCDIEKSKMNAKENDEEVSQGNSQNSMEILSNLSTSSPVNVQSLLLEAYSSIGEPDGVYGYGAGRLTDTTARIHTYEHEHAWGKALTAYDLEIETPLMSTQIGLLHALQNFGLSHTLNTYLCGLEKKYTEHSSELCEFQYQAAWRNCHWDFEDGDRSADANLHVGYHQSLYNSVCALRDREEKNMLACLSQARHEVLKSLSDASLESIRNIYTSLGQLQSLVELENFADMMLHHINKLEMLQLKWNSQSAIVAQNDYEFIEPILALRNVLLHVLMDKNKQGSSTHIGGKVLDGLVKHLEYTAAIARKANRPQAAERAIFTLKQLDQQSCASDSSVSWSWQLEESKMYWDRGEQNTALHIMMQLAEKLSKIHTRNRSLTNVYAQVLGIHGNWLAETHSESPNNIMTGFLEKAVNLYEAIGDTSREAMDAYLAVGRFADSQYQTIVNYMKSTTFELKQALLKKSNAELSKLETTENQRNKYVMTLMKQQQFDQQEMDNLKFDRATYLDTAVNNYLRCLHLGDYHDMRVFRLCSLWFENSHDKEVNEILKDELPKVQSRKFLPLMYQLAARMTTKTQQNEYFHSTLNQLIERTTVDHPHHTLFVILALSNANKDEILTAPKKKRSSLSINKTATSTTNGERMQAAKNMIERLRNERGAIIQAMEKLCDAYISVAYHDVGQQKRDTKPINLPSHLVLPKLKEMNLVAMPTVDLAVDPSCCYENIIYIKAFESTFRLAGGVNLPKIITCIASDGSKKRQLVKGRDDLRQDAVMQQMFGLVNKLLQKEPETRKRKLTVRKYKVIPLSQRSGVLEWCEGTMPLGEYLIGSRNDGAHQRYYPQDLLPTNCRIKMNNAHKSGHNNDKYEAYMEVCNNFHPVFRHFFLEKFQDPAIWFERRLAYTRSVATSSIVGYVVGLGDRHVQNILIDCNTAELVHIDLGVAFEQGRILPTPETVPFRLTRDIVDGMGVAQVEGVFRRCCEKTMKVMHNNQESMLTILEVFLYDPLYVWTLSPIKAMKLQQMKPDADASELNITNISERDIFDGSGDSAEGSTEESNKMAERVLLRLQQKLKGVEDGIVVSVSGQVNRLLQEARDPKNLCKLFPGWQSWI